MLHPRYNSDAMNEKNSTATGLARAARRQGNWIVLLESQANPKPILLHGPHRPGFSAFPEVAKRAA